jgi:hypothetical protein
MPVTSIIQLDGSGIGAAMLAKTEKRSLACAEPVATARDMFDLPVTVYDVAKFARLTKAKPEWLPGFAPDVKFTLGPPWPPKPVG